MHIEVPADTAHAAGLRLRRPALTQLLTRSSSSSSTVVSGRAPDRLLAQQEVLTDRQIDIRGRVGSN